MSDQQQRIESITSILWKMPQVNYSPAHVRYGFIPNQPTCNHNMISSWANVAKDATDVKQNQEQGHQQQQQPSPPIALSECGHAHFFIGKSYSEFNVAQSLKYGLWTCTSTARSILSFAFANYGYGGIPVYIFFSVNNSGQFCGVARMKGPVMSLPQHVISQSNTKTTSYGGCFPVQWLLVKDIPNSALRRIRVSANNNRPVTNSRDAQELSQEEGLALFDLFLRYCSKTSLLDDVAYYDKLEHHAAANASGYYTEYRNIQR